MTYQRREEIFSKEALTIEDMIELTGKSYGTAAKLMRDMKRKSDRLKVDGMIHILDYFYAMGIDPADPGIRYFKKKEPAEEPTEISEPYHANRSVCFPGSKER